MYYVYQYMFCFTWRHFLGKFFFLFKLFWHSINIWYLFASYFHFLFHRDKIRVQNHWSFRRNFSFISSFKFIYKFCLLTDRKKKQFLYNLFNGNKMLPSKSLTKIISTESNHTNIVEKSFSLQERDTNQTEILNNFIFT